MLVWTFFDFSKWTLEQLEAESGLKSRSSNSDNGRSFLAGRVALKQLLKLNHLDQEITLDESFGFLKLRNCFGSIAHTEEISVAAISSSPIGIDVESSQREVKRALSKIASEQEIKNLVGMENEFNTQVKDHGLFLWTAKEAFSKALGLGLREGIKELKVQLVGPGPYQAESHSLTPMTLVQPIVCFHIIKSYLISFCFEKKLGSKPLQLDQVKLRDFSS